MNRFYSQDPPQRRLSGNNLPMAPLPQMYHQGAPIHYGHVLHVPSPVVPFVAPDLQPRFPQMRPGQQVQTNVRPTNKKTTPNMVADKKFNFNVKNYKFLSGRVRENAVGMMYFSGATSKNSLTGGCGWWVVDQDVVVAYGAAPVVQTFPSMIRLEYEALLNGLQAAIRKGLRHVIVKSSNNLILTRLSGGLERCPFFSTIDRDIKDIYTAIQRSLSQFQTVDFELIAPTDAFYSQKLAEKAVSDHQQHIETNVTKKQNEPPKINKLPLNQLDELIARSYDDDETVATMASNSLDYSPRTFAPVQSTDMSVASTESYSSGEFLLSSNSRDSIAAIPLRTLSDPVASGAFTPSVIMSPAKGLSAPKFDNVTAEDLLSYESPKGINVDFLNSGGWQLFI